ncbi:MAG: F0F1 ATP synthase subunit A [Chloroflexi bacterium]|nr:F0F1 ATP synthase subunit A [Chloroflexota bacterium]
MALFALVIIGLLTVGFLSGPLGKSMFPGVHLPEWLSVHQPEPSLPPEAIFTLFGFHVTNSIVGAWFTIIFLVVVSFIITRRMKLVPGRLQGIFEFLLGWVYNLCQNVAGEKNGRRFFPIVCTIFLFVAFNAWLGLLPGFGSITIVNPEGHVVPLLRPANTDINMPLALALASFVFVELFGLRSLGIRYLGKFVHVGPLFSSLGLIFRGRARQGFAGLITGVIDVFVGLLEGLSELVRIVSFTFRLFGNMTAGEILLLIAAFLVPWVFALPFYGLELLVGFVQALIFSGLTLVFLTLASAPHGGEGGHPQG